MSVAQIFGRPIGDRQRIAFAVAVTVLLVAAGGLALSPSGTGRIDSAAEVRDGHATTTAGAARGSTSTSDPARTDSEAGTGGPTGTAQEVATPLVEGAAQARAERPPSAAETDNAAVGRVARQFLRGYLPYLYGHGPATAIGGSTATLRRHLTHARLRVSPATRRRRPRVVRVRISSLKRHRWHAVVTVTDGGVARYPIELLLRPSLRGPVVAAVVSE